MEETAAATFLESSPRAALIAATKEEAKTPAEPGARFINRELSWLRFNRRVLAEALDDRLPLLERVRFLSIFGSNLDEFFMIRVSGLRAQMATAASERSADGMTPAEQLAATRRDLLPTLEQCTSCWCDHLLHRLRDEGIRILSYRRTEEKAAEAPAPLFQKAHFPDPDAARVRPRPPVPAHLESQHQLGGRRSRPEPVGEIREVACPVSLPRFVTIPDEEKAETYEELGLQNISEPNFVWLEEVIAANLDLLFPEMEVVASYPFRVTRDADAEIEKDEAGDLLTVISHLVERRHFGRVVRLEIDGKMPDRIRDILTVNLELAPYQVYTTTGPLGIADLAQLVSVDRPNLKYHPFGPVVRRFASKKEGIFNTIARGDIVLHHPYDSADPVLEFLSTASTDPDVIAIKQTLYRVGPDSPVVRFLKEARENDKQVAALVELKARFDEEHNIVWAQELEDAGVHVVYGVVGLKTHAKMTLVVRREGAGIRLYVHLATGNYNPVTSRIYTDIGLLTCNQDLARDVLDLFNGLTGYSAKTEYAELIVAPGSMREHMIARIDREIEIQRTGGAGYIAWKCNSLSDEAMIDALYRASSAGVKVELLIRGICCLRPQVLGLSDNITVTSVVGRFLEHERIYYFGNGGKEELLIGSADMMLRNLDRRVEVLVPIKDPELRTAIRDGILNISLRDTVKSWELCSDGSYRRREAGPGELLNSQEYLMLKGGAWRRE